MTYTNHIAGFIWLKELFYIKKISISEIVVFFQEEGGVN